MVLFSSALCLQSQVGDSPALEDMWKCALACLALQYKEKETARGSVLEAGDAEIPLPDIMDHYHRRETTGATAAANAPPRPPGAAQLCPRVDIGA